MATKTFNTLASEDWTVPAGVTSIVVEATGPGADGQGPQSVPGVGGESLDDIGTDAYGVGQFPGDGPAPTLEARAYIDLTGDSGGLFEYSPADNPIAIGPFGEDADCVLIGAGGQASETAGGGGGGRIDFTIPMGESATLTLGAIGETTTLTDDATSNTMVLNAGGDASGDTPGTGGTTSDSTGWSTNSQNGNDGTGPSSIGGNGGDGGNWASITGITVTPGETITCARNMDETSAVMGGLYIFGFFGRDPAYSDFGPVTSEHAGGLGWRNEVFQDFQGGGGGKAATSAGDGADGEEFVTGFGQDGADGVNPGDGGDAASGDGVSGGAGQLGFAVISYEVSSTPPTITSNGGGDTASISVASGFNGIVTTVTATGDGPITFGFGGGEDDSLFSIDPDTGVLTFNSPPDFNNPQDSGLDNTYVVEVTATNDGGSDSQLITVTVTASPSTSSHGAAAFSFFYKDHKHGDH